MITKGIIERFFEAAAIQRWNDHVRPVEFTELGKQAHKAVIAFLLAKFEGKAGLKDFSWTRMIEGGIFEFLPRVILTDIKPPVFHKMMKRKGEEIKRYVLKELEGDVKSIKGDFLSKFEQYLFDPNYSHAEKRILRAAHYLATHWEFKIIYHSSPFIYGIEKTKEEIENALEDHYELPGVQKLALGKKSFGFVDLCGQLRFQQRWAQTPRAPKTSVLGHMLIVAMLAYLFSREIGACDKRIYNNFYAGLFHDLPEVLTRDIASPVKRLVEGLQDIIEEYEQLHVEEVVLPLLPASWQEEMRYFLTEPFKNRARIEGQIHCLDADTLCNEYNADAYDPLDGEILKACDDLAALIEAAKSIQHGIKSPNLEEAKQSIYEQYKEKKICGIEFHRYFNFFKGD